MSEGNLYTTKLEYTEDYTSTPKLHYKLDFDKLVSEEMDDLVLYLLIAFNTNFGIGNDDMKDIRVSHRIYDFLPSRYQKFFYKII